MKMKFSLISALALCASAFVPAGHAETGIVSAGITNTTIAAASTNSALGTSPMKMDSQDNVQLCAVFYSTTTNAANAVFNYHRVTKNGDVETAPFFSWTIAQVTSTPGTTVTNRNVALTNVPAALVGANHSLLLTNIMNTSALSPILNPTNYLTKKTLKRE